MGGRPAYCRVSTALCVLNDRQDSFCLENTLEVIFYWICYNQHYFLPIVRCVYRFFFDLSYRF